jgi:hypothetical protein
MLGLANEQSNSAGKEMDVARRRAAAIAAAIAFSISLVLLFGCSEDVYIGQMKPNECPVIRLTNGPIAGDTVQYRVQFYWLGYDPDGSVDFYEVVLVTGDPIGFDPADTTGLDKWTRTLSADTLLTVRADQFDTTVTINLSKYGLFDRTHTFFVRAVDNRGMRSEAAYRSFTAFTLAPGMLITSPRNPSPGSSQFLANRITFVWQGKDPIDSPWNYQDVESVRYFCKRYLDFTIDDLNKEPERFEDWWVPWIARDAPGDSGISTVIGDEEFLEIGRDYIFAVQGKDEAGAVTSIFSLLNNVRHFHVLEPTGPLLEIHEPILGSASFIGLNYRTPVFYVPAGFPLNFNWKALPGLYGGIVSTYRYGWDIGDIDDPSEWDVSPSPYHISAPTMRYYSGVHTLFVEAVDDYGARTIGQVEISVITATMERDLLWVDDFYSIDFIPTDYSMPTEKQHDEFWLDVCSQAKMFDEDLDVYDTTAITSFPSVPDVQRIMRYRNIVWTFTSDEEVCAWNGLIEFIPESETRANPNLLLFFLSAGGHLWTSGKSDRGGGLAAVFPHAMAMPANLRCEIYGPSLGCADTSGTTCFAYRDYCVSALDKVQAEFRTDVDLDRDMDKDALHSAYKDPSNPLTLSHPGLPEELDLWYMVTRDKMFFDPAVRGFWYVEIYNPAYWMSYAKIETQSCFNPMYRMRSRYGYSPLNNQVIAFWFTKYANIVPEAEGTIAAPSVHFGIPLWFFDHDTVKLIAREIFSEWQVSLY